jgi:lipid II:glycine glycyltransferase (peptidoglycan interpeptide bridge formation enzyme)
MSVREATAAELERWDAMAVDAPGGHVYQSRAWAEHRAATGWAALHVLLDDRHPALVLSRPWPLVGGAGAYVPRGPIVAGDAGDGGAAAATRVIELAAWLSRRSIDVVATDAEVPASERAYGAALRSGGFHPIPEIQPSRHRLSLALAPDTDDAAVRAGLSKGTRQRIAAAEDVGVAIVRHDRAGWGDGPGRPLFDPPTRPVEAALEDFATLLEATGERLGFRFGPRAAFLAWWRRAHAAGHLVHLEALEPDDAVLGGLILYRHGGRLTTVHSGDDAAARERVPGVMHLLRWRAIQLAIREGCTEMDLGGVDRAPDHREPGPGDPMAGLYEHKRSFGAEWVEMTGAHERVMRSWRYTAGRLAARATRGSG